MLQERLKERLEKAKAALRKEEEEQTESSGFRSRVPRQGRTRSFRSRFDDADREEDDDETSRSSSSVGSRSRSRPSRPRQSSEEETSRSGSGRRFSSSKNKIREKLQEQLAEKDAPKPITSKPSRNRFTPKQDSFTSTKPSSATSKSFSTKSDKPSIVFKKFNRFDRPDRRALLRSKLFGSRPNFKRPGQKEDVKEKEEANKEGGNEEEKKVDQTELIKDNAALPSALVISTIDDADILQVFHPSQ